ncbi:glycosyltransferase [Pseudactinotalea sp. HY158]|nr:glycosyltransferase [Pseudactinotalea sp. HY158]
MGADLVHAHGLRAGALAALALTGLRTRLVVTLHNKPVGGRAIQAVSAILARIIARRAGAVLGVSGDLVDWARGWGVPIVERALVPAPPPTRPGTPIPAADLLRASGEPILLTVARLAPQKGMGLLLEAATAVVAAYPHARWLVAGDGPLREQLTRAAAGGPVTFLGARSDIADLLATATVVVSTSEWEGQPLNLQEALRAGAAIVTTDVGGSGEVTGEAALRVRCDAGEVAGAVLELLNDPARLERLRAAATERANELPTTSEMLDQADQIYLRLLG